MDHFCLCRIRDLYRAILNFEQYFEQHYDLNLNEAMCKDDKRRMRFSLTALGEERLARLQTDDIEVPEILR